VYSAIRRTLAARKKTTTMPTQAPALIQSAEKPSRNARPAPPKRLPEPIQVQIRVPTRICHGTDRPATMKSSWVDTFRARRRAMNTSSPR